MKLVEKSSGRLVDVAEDKVPAAFASGQYGFRAGEHVPVVSPDGEVGTVPAEQAQAALEGGYRAASAGELHRAKNDEKYGGVAGGLMAAGEGAARGLTVGLFDPLAVGAARAFGGEQAAQATREHLAGVQEAHPYVSGGAEIAGAIAPMLLPGAGEASAARLAGEAGNLARTAGAIPRGVAAAGQLAERGAGALVGGEAASLLGRVAQQAIRKGASGAVEGALFGGGQEVSEATLQDHELTGEKLLVAMGHSALLGSALGVGLAGVGEAGADVGKRMLGAAGGKVSGLAEEQAFRALNPRKAFAVKADEIPGGMKGIGRELLDGGLVRAGDTLEQIAPRVAEARELAGARLGDILQAADAAGFEGPRLAEIEGRIRREVMPELAKLGHTNASAIQRVENLIADLRGYAEKRHGFEAPRSVYDIALARSEETAPRAQRALSVAEREHEAPSLFSPNAALEEQAGALPSPIRIGGQGASLDLNPTAARTMARDEAGHLMSNAPRDAFGVGPAFDVGIKPGARTGEASSIRKPIRIAENEGASEKALSGARADYDKELRLTFKEAQDFRAKLDDIIRWNTSPLSPVNEAAEGAKRVRGIIEDTLVKAGDEASAARGGSFKEAYEAAKLRYRRLAVADKAAEDAVSRAEANRAISPSDYLVGIGGLAGGLAGHGMHGGLAGLAMGAAHHVIRERGNATAAVMLDRIAAIGGVQRVARQVDEQIDQAIAGFFQKGEPRQKLARVRLSGQAANDTQARYDEEVSRVRAVAQHASVPARVDERLSGLAGHAPQTAAAVSKTAQAATAFLASKLPPSDLDPSSLTPHLSTRPVTASERTTFLRYADAVEDPTSVLRELEKGTLTPEGVEAIQATYPRLYDQVRTKVAEQLAARKTPLAYQKVLQLGVLLDMPTDATLQPDFLRDVAASYAHPQQPHGSPSGAPKKLASLTAQKTPIEAAQGM